MRRFHRFLTATTTAVAAAVALGSPASVALVGADEPTLTLTLSKLPRGAASGIAHIEGTTLVDGSTRIFLDADRVTLLGRSGTGYIVGTARDDGSRGRILRLEPDGTTLRLGRADPYASVVSSDGSTVVSARIKYADKTSLKARSASTGARLGKTVIGGYVAPLDAAGGKVLVAGYGSGGTREWDIASDEVARLTRRLGSVANYRLDLLAAFTKDTFEGGCTVVSRISEPATRLWKSCTEAVAAFSTDGSHVVTTDILSDGLGPSRVEVRTVSGAEVASYAAGRRGYFGGLEFEAPTALMVELNGPHRAATIRCVATSCERASGLRRVDTPKQISDPSGPPKLRS